MKTPVLDSHFKVADLLLAFGLTTSISVSGKKKTASLKWL